MNPFFLAADTPWTDLGDGIRRKIVGHTPHLMSVLVQFDQGAVGTPHAHDARPDRLRRVSGAFECDSGGQRCVLRAGDAFWHPPDACTASWPWNPAAPARPVLAPPRRLPLTHPFDAAPALQRTAPDLPGALRAPPPSARRSLAARTAPPIAPRRQAAMTPRKPQRPRSAPHAIALAVLTLGLPAPRHSRPHRRTPARSIVTGLRAALESALNAKRRTMRHRRRHQGRGHRQVPRHQPGRITAAHSRRGDRPRRR
jgi:hypothetical protein